MRGDGSDRGSRPGPSPARVAPARLIGWAALAAAGVAGARAADVGVVEVEEVVASAVEAGNGAGPLWCYGAPLIARAGDEVFASVMEVGPGVPPPCNTRWRLLRRRRPGWEEVARAEGFREREPCPLAVAGPLGLLLSTNPAVEAPGATPGRCDPQLLRFDIAAPGRPTPLRPGWSGSPRFAAHSYRGLGVDPARGEALALNIDAATDEQRWALLTSDGRPGPSGAIRFPIRACYPQVALREGAGHVLALGDVVEPVAAWRDHKRARGGGTWDYVFRRLFYAGAPDLAAGGFAPPVEVDSVESTGGDLRNLDLYLGRDGVAHALYLKTDTVAALRDAFFPGRKVASTLEYAAIARGQVARRLTLIRGGEGTPATPQYARFHATVDGTLHVVAAVQDASSGLEDRIIPLPPGREPGPPARLGLHEPLRIFFTAAERGGNPPSDTLDLLGQDARSDDLRYARVRLR